MSTTKCQNCGKEIESFKMVLHERFCSLNVRKCSFCNEPIQIDEYPEHKNLKHTDLNCEKCGKKFPADKYNSHLKSCSKKLIECKFCGLFLEQDDLTEHEYQCGSKTVQCDYCGLNIPQMEYDLHLEYTCKIKQKFDNPEKNENSSKKGRKIDESFKNMKNLENEIFDKKPSKKRNNIKDKKKSNSKEKIKFEEFNNDSNTMNKKINYMEKYADDFINNSNELNFLDFDDDIKDIPNSNDKGEINDDKNESNNNNENIIDNILYKGKKRRQSKNKNFEKEEKKEKKQKKDKSKEKEGKKNKRKKGKKRKNSSSFSNSFSNNEKNNE